MCSDAPTFYRAVRLLVLIYGSPSTSRPVWRSGVLPLNSPSRRYGPFQRPSAPAPRFIFGISICKLPLVQCHATAMSGMLQLFHVRVMGRVSRSRLHSRRNTAKICTDDEQSEYADAKQPRVARMSAGQITSRFGDVLIA
jgi:hypothetical protein